jgi:hypothetical protein
MVFHRRPDGESNQQQYRGWSTRVRIYAAIAVMAALLSPAMAALRMDVYLSDGNTPLAPRDPNTPGVYRDVMVGTKLSVIVSSDKKTKMPGIIGMPWDDLSEGELTARGYDGALNMWQGSCLKDSGTNSSVWNTRMDAVVGFYFMSGGLQICPGKWFIFDYLATTVGSCDIILGAAPVVVTGGGEPPLTTGETMAIVMKITLNHVPSRDFNNDTVVNARDFAHFANHWRTPAGADPNSTSAKSDLDADGYVGMSDLRLLNQFWLARTDVSVPLDYPNAGAGPQAAAADETANGR